MKICIDLFSGLGGFSQAFRESDEWKVIEVDNDATFEPTITEDILNLTYQDLPQNPDVVLLSPPCTCFTMAASGTHIDSDGRPVSERGREHLQLLHHSIGLVKALDPDFWFLENPMGGMRGQLGKPDAEVWYCQYGSNRAKPTDIWGRLPDSFNPDKCKNNHPLCHHESAPRGSDTGTQSNSLTSAERAKVPYELSKEILESIENPESRPGSLLEL